MMRGPTKGSATDAALPVSVYGIVRGTEWGGAATLSLDEGALTIAQSPDARALTLDIARLDGLRLEGRQLSLYLRDGDVLELNVAESDADALARAADAIQSRAHAFPELTRALRGLGARRARPGPEHDRFFAPLLAARAAVERAQGASAQLSSVDTRALAIAIDDALRDLAATRVPERSPERRALEAQLLDCAESLFVDITRVGELANAALEGDPDTAFARWRAWAHAVAALFEQADACWFDCIPLLASVEPPRAPLWRRLLGLGARDRSSAGAKKRKGKGPRGSGGATAALFVLCGALAGTSLFSGAARAQDSTRAALPGGPHRTVRVRGANASVLTVQGFDVVSQRDGAVLVVVDSIELARLRALGFDATPMIVPGEGAPGRAGLAAVPIYRPFDDPARGIQFFLDSLVRANPRVHLDTIGRSFEGRSMLAVKIGAADDAPARPNVLYMATYHAREWATTEMALRLIRYLAQPRGVDVRVDNLIDRRDVWIVPVANPDGYQFTFTSDRLWRKNRRPLVVPVRGTSNGADLNRNHSTNWGYDDIGSSPDPFSEIFRGTGPASEPEVQAIEQFHQRHPPVVAISYHTFAGLLLYPPGFRFGVMPGDLSIYRALAGTEARPAVPDHLPGTDRFALKPAVAWNLYTTNGEYTEFAAARYGTIGFTPELTSGYESDRFYGFVFPEDESRLQQLFADNLPFALDVMESAEDPSRYFSPSTGTRPQQAALESVSPVVRVRVPASLAASTRLRLDGGPDAAMRPDSLDTVNHFFRRLVSDAVPRPRSVVMETGVSSTRYDVLAASGAESTESGWSGIGFVRDSSSAVAGRSAWRSFASSATLRSPMIAVPSTTDTLSLLYWTTYVGSGFDPEPHGEVRVSRDGGATFTREGSVSGFAPVFYPEQIMIGGVRGRSVQIEFGTTALPWLLDEIAVLSHTPQRLASDTITIALRPSENPVRGASVTFAWPFGTGDGDLLIYDFTGRLVWRAPVSGGADVVWDVANSGVANGAFVAVARSRAAAAAPARTSRVTLFVTR